MKKLTIFSISILLAMCSVKTDAISSLNRNIKKYIDKNADDPSSYEPIKTIVFGDTAIVYRDKGCYYFIHSFRIKNKLGAVVKEESFVRTDRQLNVLSMRKEFD